MTTVSIEDLDQVAKAAMPSPTVYPPYESPYLPPIGTPVDRTIPRLVGERQALRVEHHYINGRMERRFIGVIL